MQAVVKIWTHYDVYKPWKYNEASLFAEVVDVSVEYDGDEDTARAIVNVPFNILWCIGAT